MKKIQLRNTLLAAGIVLCAFGATAQNWRSHKEGIPSGGAAVRSIYGEGTRIIVANVSATVGAPVYYTPDSSTAFTATPSNLGFFATMESSIVKCQSKLFVGGTQGVSKSSDGGVTWSATAQVSTCYQLYAYGNTLYASIGAGLGLPMMSTDTGNTWVNVPGYSGGLATAYLMFNGTLYIGSTGGIQYTSDNGTTWHSVTTTQLQGQTIVGLAALGNNVYTACSTGVYETADNGATWNNVLAVSLFCLTKVDTVLLAGSATSGIYKSDANGGNWATINNGLPYVGSAAYTAVNYIAYNDDYPIAATQGDSLLYVTNLGELGLHPVNTTAVAQVSSPFSFGVYPNPAANEVSITLTGQTTNATATLYDMTGKQVRSMVCIGKMTKMNIAAVPQGVYMLEVNTGKECGLQRVLIEK